MAHKLPLLHFESVFGVSSSDIGHQMSGMLVDIDSIHPSHTFNTGDVHSVCVVLVFGLL